MNDNISLAVFGLLILRVNFDAALTISYRIAQQWRINTLLAHHRLNRTPRTPDAPAGENRAWEAAHKHFHMALIGACGSKLMTDFCDRLYDSNIRYRNIAGQGRSNPARSGRSVTNEHQAIFDAAIARDADKAVELLLSHYRNTGTELARNLSES